MAKSKFISAFQAAIEGNRWVKCTLSRPGPAAGKDLKTVYLRPVEIKKGLKIAFNYRYATRDEVKNYDVTEAVALLEQWLGTAFLHADLFTLDGDLTYSVNKKGEDSIQEKPASQTSAPTFTHDRVKTRLLDPSALWLHRLGITSARGEVLANAQDKWRQINKYLEIIGALLREHPLPPDAHIVDMGSGKGYLTFALYDYLVRQHGMQPRMTGVELRSHLVDFCNALSQEAGFAGLQFIAQDIGAYAAPRIDMLIALHACDTATDLALAKGLSAQAALIVAAPCCHKQIRKEMAPRNALAPVLRNGILEERQAEIITDGIRALLLTSRGYQTKVFEFISSEHTAKNVMITAIRAAKPNERGMREALESVGRIKSDFGIRRHQLEVLLTEGESESGA